MDDEKQQEVQQWLAKSQFLMLILMIFLKLQKR